MKSYLNEKYDNLDSIAEENCNSYVSADPFPHIVFDNFFDGRVLFDGLEESSFKDDFHH